MSSKATPNRKTTWRERQRPRTVTRYLPYVIGPGYKRLQRLKREYDHMRAWRGYASRRMIEAQCESLHYRLYGEVCYYGALPPEAYAHNSPFM